MAKYIKDKVVKKYVKWYGNPVRFNNNYFYLTESPQLQFKNISTDKVQLYYSACVLSRREVDESIPDTKGIVNLVEYEMIWKIHDCYINQRGWFYDSEIDGNLVGKIQLASVEDACDWNNPLIVRGGGGTECI